MKVSKLIYIAVALCASKAFAAETPPATFSIWGEPSSTNIGYYNLIRNLPGQEFVGYTANCFDGGTSNQDKYVLRAPVYDAVTGVAKYEFTLSIEYPNTSPNPDCQFDASFGVGSGVAVSGEKRVVVLGMSQLGANGAVISANNAETGVNYYVKNFPFHDDDGFSLATKGAGYGEWSAVGNFLNNRSDQLRVAYFKFNTENGVDVKITYYNVLTGNQIGNTVLITVPAPELLTP